MNPSRSLVRLSSGFTLIEVAIAVGILAVSLVALLGLLPGGMTNFRKAMDTSVTAQISQRILHDIEQAEFDEVIDFKNVPKDKTGYCVPHYSFRMRSATKSSDPKNKSTGSPVRYFDEQGAEVIPSSSAPSSLTPEEKSVIVYYVNTRVIPRAQLPIKGDAAGEVAQITIQVARNPGHRDIAVVAGSDSDPNTPNRNLFKNTTGIQIYTYNALVGKNQGR